MGNDALITRYNGKTQQLDIFFVGVVGCCRRFFCMAALLRRRHLQIAGARNDVHHQT